MTLAVVILAAGQGSRMKSAIPKVLHKLAGMPLLGHVITAARCLQPAQIIVVYGHEGASVQAAFPDPDITWVEQTQQLGTGHAVQQAMPALSQAIDRLLVLYGDVPLIQPTTLQTLLARSAGGFGLLTLSLDDPTGYGRIQRDITQQKVVGIVEQKDANVEQRAIQEVNTGIMALPVQQSLDWLSRLSNSNAQGEYYLTDLVAMAVQEGMPIEVTQPAQAIEAYGVNDRQQLAIAERAKQRMQADDLMLAGVTLQDPQRFDLRGTLQQGQDCTIDVNVLLEGNVSLGNRVHIGANTVLRNVQIADNVTILENCVIEDTSIGPDSQIGPFARLRPGTELAQATRVGNFVEIKKSQIGSGSKVNHLAYVGDSEVGQQVNLGAGTITCNYDGANKHKTMIEDGVFVGSNSALVAPVTLRKNATIGAGSVISQNAPEGALSLTRGNPKVIQNWQRPVKRKPS
jgi:bifunctional UDP-N-acetylglucosamine pyrophosphorylase/glucosamine-1-phosphate N-acetyltransferase